MKLRFRVWHIPQVPMKAFLAEVPTYEEAVRLKDALASYDLFQFENNVKPDYCNANGIQVFDYSLSKTDLQDMGLDDAWSDFEDQEDLNDMILNMVNGGFIDSQEASAVVSPGMIDAGKEVLLNVPGGDVEEQSDQVVVNIFRAMLTTQQAEKE